MKSILLLIILIILASASLSFAEENESTQEVLVEQYLEHYECQGVTNERCNLLKLELRPLPGYLISSQDIEKIKFDLIKSNRYESVEVSLKKGTLKNFVILELILEEKNNTIYHFDYNFSSQSFFSNDPHTTKSSSFSGGFTQFNVAGTNNIYDVSIKNLKSNNHYSNTVGDNEVWMLTNSLSFPKPFGNKDLFANIKLNFYRMGYDYYPTGKGNSTYNTEISSNNIQIGGEIGKNLADNYFISLGGYAIDDKLLKNNDIKNDNFFTSLSHGYDFYLSYGFDDQDNDIFPRSGSKFMVRLNYGTYANYMEVHEKKSDFYFVGFLYNKHFAINDNEVFGVKFQVMSPFYFDYDKRHQTISINYARMFENFVKKGGYRKSHFYVETGLYRPTVLVHQDVGREYGRSSESYQFRSFLETGLVIDSSFTIIKISFLVH